jgi:Fe-S cluster assembly protein SufD
LVSDTARAVFQGLIRVEKAAVQTVALQENKNLLIGSHSRVTAMPRLEILPDDVMCKHGSATGELDPKRLYYLTTRGFSEADARTMVVQGFVRDGLRWLESDVYLQSLSDNLLSLLLETVSVV